MKVLTLIEVYKSLESCQVVLLCKEELSLYKVSVECDAIILTNCADEVLCKITFSEIHMKPNSISGLLVKGNVVTFRVGIKSETMMKQLQNAGVKYQPNVSTNCETNILCACCSNIICKDVVFKRILPLPSVDDWSHNDFFCHKHTEDSGISLESKSKLEMVTKCDLLYGANYAFRVSTDCVAGFREFGVIHCNKCLSWIGEKTRNHVKLWNCCVKFSTLENDFVSALNDFNNAVLCTLNSNCVGNILKLVITCAVTNESVHFILLNILNKSVNILTNYEQSDLDSCDESEDVKLSEKNVVKVSYSYFKEENETIQTWLSNPFSDSIEVSKQMLLAGCNSLVKSTRIIPEPYRRIGDMNVGYLCLCV